MSEHLMPEWVRFMVVGALVEADEQTLERWRQMADPMPDAYRWTPDMETP